MFLQHVGMVKSIPLGIHWDRAILNSKVERNVCAAIGAVEYERPGALKVLALCLRCMRNQSLSKAWPRVDKNVPSVYSIYDSIMSADPLLGKRVVGTIREGKEGN